MKTIDLPFAKELRISLEQPRPLIQVVLGPRQVGKTTTVLKFLKDHHQEGDYHYCSSDSLLAPDETWILEQHQKAIETNPSGLLVIDEIQNVPHWAKIIKRLWDDQKINDQNLKMILLGSSSLKIQTGLTESLAGRYEVHIAHHWNFCESQEAYNLDLEDFIVFGGYPESYRFIENVEKWSSYIKMSVVDAVIGKDILTQAKVKSPALFKQCFEILSSYPAQEISYTKLLGQLQGKGHVDQIKYYIDLFEGAFLIKALSKYSSKETLKRSSSPKILPLCQAFFGAKKFGELSSEEKGRAFEVAVGSMLNRLPGNLFYWREGNHEVDFVLEQGKSLYTIEVKSGKKRNTSGLLKFKSKFPQAKSCFITLENLESFSSQGLAFLEKHAVS